MLELMHFPKEIVDLSEFKNPAEKKLGKSELNMAKELISGMTEKWDPEQYNDDYHEALEKLIEEKIEHGDKAEPKPAKKPKPTNVVDLVSVLRESLQQTGKSSSKPAKKTSQRPSKTKSHSRRAATHKKAA